MSRIGNKPVKVADNVKVLLDGRKVSMEGPQGKLSLLPHDAVQVKFDPATKVITVSRIGDDPQHRALHGLTRALVHNMVEGVSKGYVIGLEVHGVGYNAKLQGQSLILNVGYCHPITHPVPAGLKVAVTVNAKDKNVSDITVSGPDKQLVGEFAAVVRKTRPPEPYKQKGIRYKDEVIMKKQGKAFASGSGAS